MKTSPRRKARLYKQQRRTELRLKVANIKESQPCMDCDFFYPAPIMEFDHRPGEKKLDTVSSMVMRQLKWVTIAAEIAKCDLVCANCHRFRTHCCRVKKLQPQKSPVRGNSTTS